MAAGLDHFGHDLSMGHRYLEQKRLGGIKKPVDMLFKFKHAPVVRANALEDTVPVQQAVIENRNFCVTFAVILAIDKNFHAGRA